MRVWLLFVDTPAVSVVLPPSSSFLGFKTSTECSVFTLSNINRSPSWAQTTSVSGQKYKEQESEESGTQAYIYSTLERRRNDGIRLPLVVWFDLFLMMLPLTVLLKCNLVPPPNASFLRVSNATRLGYKALITSASFVSSICIMDDVLYYNRDR